PSESTNSSTGTGSSSSPSTPSPTATSCTRCSPRCASAATPPASSSTTWRKAVSPHRSSTVEVRSRVWCAHWRSSPSCTRTTSPGSAAWSATAPIASPREPAAGTRPRAKSRPSAGPVSPPDLHGRGDTPSPPVTSPVGGGTPVRHPSPVTRPIGGGTPVRRTPTTTGPGWRREFTRSRAPRKLREVRLALGLERLAAFLGLVGAVEQQVGLVRQLLDPGVAVLVRVEAHLRHAQRPRRHGQHLPAPAQRLLLQLLQRHHGVDQTHL